MEVHQLISYIALGAPATRRPATGDLPYLRAEIGFTPNWYQKAVGVDFGEQWHNDPIYRKQSLLLMRQAIDHRFGENKIGSISESESSLDLLTGVFGSCSVAAMFGVPIRYEHGQWPVCEPFFLSDETIRSLKPVHPASNHFFLNLMTQLDKIAEMEGRVVGFVNWQGVLNNAHRLRGAQLFLDMLLDPKLAINLMDCVTITMIDAARMLQEKQRQSGVAYSFFTVSNCLVNMIQPELYQEFVLPFDQRIAEAFEVIGIHNCAWNASPYLDGYTSVPKIGYLDMGIGSDLKRARELFPAARRALMYTPMDLENKPIELIHQDLEYIASSYGPCDIVAADIDAGTADRKVAEFIQICGQISSEYAK